MRFDSGVCAVLVASGVLLLAPSRVVAQTQSVVVGPVTMSAPNPIAMSPLENSTNFDLTAHNSSTQAVTLEFTSWDEIRSTKPVWITHFYKYFGLEDVAQITTMTIAAGQSLTLPFYTSQDRGLPPQEAQVPFRFRVGAATGTLMLTLTADARGPELMRTANAEIAGQLLSSTSQPIAGAIVSAALFNENARVTATTGADGRYTLRVLSAQQIAATLGTRPLPYSAPTTYFVAAEAAGYRLGYRAGVSVADSATTTADFVLESLPGTTRYRLSGELATDGVLSYWWIRFAGNNDRIVAVQGQHDLAANPGHIISVDLTGHELWRFPTSAQCWGLDVSPDGQTIAAGCHDAYLYVLSVDGQLRYKSELGTRPGLRHVLDVRFSPDGTKLLVDGGGDARGFSVLDAATGTRLWRATVPAGQEPQGAYEARWSADGQRIVAGDLGKLALYTSEGTLIWRHPVGEAPAWLEIDGEYNVYSAGKNRELIKFDPQGNRVWTYRIAHTSNASTRPVTADASFMVVPTFNGLIQAFNSSGAVQWQRFLPLQATGELNPDGTPVTFLYGPGHNALGMSLDGNRIAIGTRGYRLLVYDRNGSPLWEHAASHRSSFTGVDPRVGSSYPGTNAVAVSPDGRYIAAGYGDSVIRIFALAPTMATTPSSLRFGATKAGAAGALTAVTPAQTVTVGFTGAPPTSWTAVSNQSWLTLTGGSGSGAAVFTAAVVNPSNVIGGSTELSATITLTAPGAANSPLTIPVTLTIDHPGGAATVAPIGQVDTPAQNATDLVGAIGVTGWALDDVGVASVKIYRPCLLFDNQASCQPILGQSVVYVGDAAFLPGARPDVEAAFPTYPSGNAAGWGMQILTNMLPHIPNQQLYGGQGALTLFVYATDLEGNVRLLGRSGDPASPDYATPTFITMGNDTIAKPFGTIDTPLLGGTISGTIANFGWVLTPDSNTTGGEVGDILMTTSGAGMVVYIDGIATATVAYNQCRGTVGNPPGPGVFCNDDIANIFGNASPQASLTARTSNPTRYRNLDATRSAIGAYVMNTTTMTNGRHQIAWGVADSAARGEGIGSRFFTVLNSGADQRTEAQLREAPAEILGSSLALDNHTPDTEGVYGRTGYALDHAWRRMFASDAGSYTVRLPESGRLELWLGEPADAGYLVANGTLRPLPVGATLAGSYFAWMPPVGYVGPYTLAFVRGDERIDVTVTVAPVASTPAGTPEVQMFLDPVRVEGPVLSERSVRVEGWAFDPKAAIGSGMGAVHVWAKRVPGPGSWVPSPGGIGGASPIFLGAANLDIARPDVAFAHADAPGHSGYQLTAALGAGTWELTAYVWNDRTARWEDARTTSVTIR